MSRRSLLKIYQVLDHEGLQGTQYGLGPLHNKDYFNMKLPSVENLDDIGRSISCLNPGTKLNGQYSNTSISTTQIKSESSTDCAEPKNPERKKSVELYKNVEKPKAVGKRIVKRRISPKVKPGPKIDHGHYIIPRFFISPEKYVEKTKNEFMYSIDSMVPPSQQSWMARKEKKQPQKEIDMKNVELEKDAYYESLKESREKAENDQFSYTTFNRVDIQRNNFSRRLQEESTKQYKKMLRLVYGNDAWRQIGSSVQEKAKKLSVQDKPKKTNIVQKQKKNEVERQDLKKHRSLKVTLDGNKMKESGIKNNLKVLQAQSVNNFEVVEAEKQPASTESWNDLEPHLPSFLSAGLSCLKSDDKKPNMKDKLEEVPKIEEVQKMEVLKVEAPKEEVPKQEVRMELKPMVIEDKPRIRLPRNLKIPYMMKKPEDICLFKYLQARSKLLRKQHSRLEKKNKQSIVKIKKISAAVKGENYDESQSDDEDSDGKEEEKENSLFARGTLCEIIDDGFKIGQNFGDMVI